MHVLWSMRVLAATAICIAVAAVAGAAQARERSIYRGKCGEVVLPSGPTGIRAAVRIYTSCGTFAVDGRGVRFLDARTGGPVVEGLVWRRQRLHFYRSGQLVWRSARWRGERAFGWTRTGLLLYWRRNVVIARTASRRVVRRFTIGPGAPHRFDPATRTLLYVTPRGELVRTDGLRTQRIASLGLPRLGRVLEIVPLDHGRVALIGNRLVVLAFDGSVVASDRRRGSWPALASRRAIAIVSTGPLDDRGRARETVRLLRPGQQSSTALFANEVGALGCGHWPSLAWREKDLLYSTTAGDVVVIDTRSGRHVDLTAAVARIPGDFYDARWSY
jgi:hypothetical protein